jgi:hypothetical protein
MRVTLSLYLLAMSLSTISISCNKMLEIDNPIESLSSDEIYKDDKKAISVLTGIYAEWASEGLFSGRSSIGVRTGLTGDELVSVADPNDMLTILYKNQLTNNGSQLFWSPLYSYIFKANSALESLAKSNSITSKVKDQLLGESYFIRAFCYFNLVNLYKDVPLVLSTNLVTNLNLPRTDTKIVYNQIEKDLIEAERLLSESYLSGDLQNITTEKVRPVKAVAKALLARVYLYTEKWDSAEKISSELINNHNYSLDLHQNVYLKESKDAIWQLQPTTPGFQNNLDAALYILYSGGLFNMPGGPDGISRPVYLSEEFYKSFEALDKRKLYWTDTIHINGTTYPFVTKYKIWEYDKPRTEYIAIFRLSEQYLIRCEARLRLGNINGNNSALTDINVIRTHSGLLGFSELKEESALDQILNERRHELFTELGHRWFDLIRTNKINDVMARASIKKETQWASYMSLFPIPVEDIRNDKNLRGHQNPGYPEQ